MTLRRAAAFAVFLVSIAFSQKFEVASVKRNTTGEKPTGDMKGGRLTMYNMPLKVLVAQAYGVSNDRVLDPAALDGEGYDIVAKLPPDANEETFRLMLRDLLAQRFHLVVHTEQKPVPVYALIVRSGGAKFHASAPDSQPSEKCAASGQEITCRQQKTTMARLAQNLPRWVSRDWFDLPIVDQTGLEGAYDLSLTWTMMRRVDDPSTPGALSLFDALEEQLGLKLERRKVPLDRIVIDHADRVPTEN